MFLSVRAFLGSLNPGVSINVMLPLFATLTRSVTDVNDGDALNYMCSISLLYLSLYTSDTLVSNVDLPYPHSPKTTIVHLLKASFCFCRVYSLGM